LEPAVPISDLGATNDSPTEFGQTTTFVATVSAGSGIIYTWYFGDQTTDSGQVVMHVYTATGSYSAVVTATNLLGSASATTVVTITDAPVAGLTAFNDSPTPLGHVTSLTATATSGSNVSYQWNLGNDVVKQGQSVTFTYEATGLYTAVVTASNSVSLLTATTPVTIYKPKYIYLPLILKTL
jgi:PKD repeat protein